MIKRILVLAACLVLSMGSVSCGWLSTAEGILSTAAPALINILQIAAIAEGKPVNAALAAKVNGDAANLTKVLSDYSAASSAAQPSICPQVQAALNTYEADLPAILQTAQVSDANTQEKIVLLSSLILGAFQAVEPVIPGCQSPVEATVAPAVHAARTARQSSAVYATAPVDLKTFVPAYNAALTSPTGNPTLDKATPKLKLHEHGKLVRMVTFGIAK